MATTLRTRYPNLGVAALAAVAAGLLAALIVVAHAAPSATATKKDERQKAIQSLETDLQATQLKFQQQFEQRKNEVMAPITDVVK